MDKTKEYVFKNPKEFIKNNGSINSLKLKKYNVQPKDFYLFINNMEQPYCICGKEAKYIRGKFLSSCSDKKCAYKIASEKTKNNPLNIERLEKQKKETIKKNIERKEQIKREKEKEKNDIISFYGFYPKGTLSNYENMNKEFLENNFIEKGSFLIEEATEYFSCSVSYIDKMKSKLNIQVKNKRKTQPIENRINEIFDYIFLERTREIIKPLELDLYSKEHKIAIEYNGLMFHSHGISKHSKFNNPKDEPKKHLNKTLLCQDKNIQLLHIFENEFTNPISKSIWVSMINLKIGKIKDKIPARKCVVKEVPTKEAKEFINKNHLQGYSNAKIKIGLYFDSKLVSIMTFGKPRYNKEYQYELIRFCSLKDTIVQGAGSKLLKAFERMFNPESLISYANLRWSQGNFYEKVGFDFLRSTSPNFFYFKENGYILESRVKFQKHKLDKILEVYDKNKTATENMYLNGYRKIYDCGNNVYIKKYK